MDKQDIISALGMYGIRSFYETEIGAQLGKINGSGDVENCSCPFHNDSSPSFSINIKTGLFNCYGCGEKGSVFDFYNKRYGGGFVDSMRYFCHLAGLEWTGNGNGTGKKKGGLFDMKWGAAKANGLKDGAEYLKVRGLSDGLIENLPPFAGFQKGAYAGKDLQKKPVKHDSIAVPMWKISKDFSISKIIGIQNIFLPPFPLIDIKGQLEPIKKRHEYKSNPNKGVYYIGDPKSKTYLITEAVIDGLSAYDAYNYNCFVISLFSTAHVSCLAGMLPQGKKIISCFDNDKAGWKAAVKMAALYPDSLCVAWSLADQYEDINNVLMSLKSPIICRMIDEAVSLKESQDILEIITIEKGERLKAAQHFMELAVRFGDIYKSGGSLVRVDARGIFQPVDVDTILYLMDLRAEWEKKTKDGSEPINAPLPVAKAVFHGFNRPFKELIGVVQNPIMKPNGEIIEKPGYDSSSYLFLDFAVQGWDPIPEEPTQNELADAFELLFTPFENFPFETDIDKSVFIAALLTAAIRAALAVSPGFYISAPTPSSGKSLLSKCLSIIAGGKAEMIPYIEGRDADEETRKRLLSIGMKAPRAIIIDNVVGSFSSSALCAWMTSETYEDRVLGSSKMTSVSTRAMFMLTGNNITPVGDLCRRLLRIHLDPQVEKPWERRFDADPLEYCRVNRLRMIRAAFIILRSGILSGKKDKRQMGSFEEWSDFIRPAIFKLNETVCDCVDPLGSIDVALSDDPETTRAKALISAIEHFVIGGVVEFTVSQLIAGTANDDDLKDILTEIGSDRLNSRMIGRFISKIKGRIYATEDGKRSIEVEGQSRSKVNRFSIRNYEFL